MRDRGDVDALSQSLSTFDPSKDDAVAIADSCLAVVIEACNKKHCVGAGLPDDADLWSLHEHVSIRGRGFVDAELWDDALDQLARTFDVLEDSFMSASAIVEVAQAVAATVRFILLPPSERNRLLDVMDAALAGASEFWPRRAAALRKARLETKTAGLDSVADSAVANADDRVKAALHQCLAAHLDDVLLRPLGFPATKMGLRTFVAATRHACCCQRAAAILGRAWHAAEAPGPLIGPISSAANDDDSGCAPTLVIAFSSLGWQGVVHAEWSATLRACVDDGRVHLVHALDTARSWFATDPMSGEVDGGAWWDAELSRLCRRYQRVCLLGDSMGGAAALRFARHATSNGCVVALVPQVDLRDMPALAADRRTDIGDHFHAELKAAIMSACAEAQAARVTVHVGSEPSDVAQAAYLPTAPRASGLAPPVEVVHHKEVPTHLLAQALKRNGTLASTILRDLGLLAAPYSVEAGPSPEWVATAAACLATNGFVVLRRPYLTASGHDAVAPPTGLGLLPAALCDACAASVHRRLRSLSDRARARDLDLINDKVYSKEVCQRSVGGRRVDLALPEEGGGDPCWETLHAAIDAFARPMLEASGLVSGGADGGCVVDRAGCVVASPGAPEQGFHRDGRDPGLVNCFVPLVPVTLANGPTELRPGSHVDDDFGVWADADAADEPPPVAPTAHKGDILLFSYQCFHRGLANNSDAMRPIAYVVYAARGVSDRTNFPAESL